MPDSVGLFSRHLHVHRMWPSNPLWTMPRYSQTPMGRIMSAVQNTFHADKVYACLKTSVFPGAALPVDQMTDANVVQILASFKLPNDRNEDKRVFLTVGRGGCLHVVNTISKNVSHIYSSFMSGIGCGGSLTVNPTMTHVRLDAVERFYRDYHRIRGFKATDETLLITSRVLWLHYFNSINILFLV